MLKQVGRSRRWCVHIVRLGIYGEWLQTLGDFVAKCSGVRQNDKEYVLYTLYVCPEALLRVLCTPV